MKKIGYSYKFIAVSFVLVVVAIAVTSILSQSESNKSTDIRAKASVTAGVKVKGVVASFDAVKRIIIVNDLRFLNPEQQSLNTNLGTWTATPPSNFNLNTLRTGKTVLITASPGTFSIPNHTLTALNITVQ